MESAVNHLCSVYAALRAGGANTTILDQVMVSCYGTDVQLRTIAAITAPDKRNLLVRPYDQETLPDIEKALLKSKTGLVPQREGKLIRLPVPPISEERRVELTKTAKAAAEDQRVAIRNIRRDVLKSYMAPSKDKQKTFENAVNELTKTYIEKIDVALQLKIDALLDTQNRWEPK